MKVRDVLLKHGRITQEQYDTLTAKETEKAKAKAAYKKDKSKLTKPELLALMDKLTED